MAEKIIFSSEQLKYYGVKRYEAYASSIGKEFDSIKYAVRDAVGGNNFFQGPFSWPRDLWTVFQKDPGQQFVIAEQDFYPNVFTAGLRYSKLGNGGASLTDGDLIIVSGSSAVMRPETRSDVNYLRSKGFRFVEVHDMSIFPEAEMERFVPQHIDGPLSLLSNSKQEKLLITTKSYLWRLKQREDAAAKFDEMRQAVNLAVIDDGGLPHQALNMLQLQDNTVVMTAGAPSLEGIVREFVEGKVVTTGVPIVEFSRLKGGIRCMTNTVPESQTIRKLLIESF